jgi:hypothetical protein
MLYNTYERHAGNYPANEPYYEGPCQLHDVLEEDFINLEALIDWDAPQFKIDCAFCGGTGVHPATMKLLAYKICPVCEGKGIQEINARRRDFIKCERCGGNGRDPDSQSIEPCTVCGGLGIRANN